MMMTTDYPSLADAGIDAQMRRAKRLGFARARGVPCMKKIVDRKHRHEGDARNEAEYARLVAAACPYLLGIDHARLWRSAEGELFVTAEPYHLWLGHLDELIAAERDLGVRVTLDGRSMYAPGYALTVLVVGPNSSVSLAALSEGSPHEQARD